MSVGYSWAPLTPRQVANGLLSNRSGDIDLSLLVDGDVVDLGLSPCGEEWYVSHGPKQWPRELVQS